MTGRDEQMTAFYEVLAKAVPLRTTATVVRATVWVVGIDIAEHGEELTARASAWTSYRNGDFRTWSPTQYRSRLDCRDVPPLPRPEGASNGHAVRLGAILAMTWPGPDPPLVDRLSGL